MNIMMNTPNNETKTRQKMEPSRLTKQIEVV